MGNLIACNSVEDDLKLSIHKLISLAMSELKQDILKCIEVEITKANNTNSKSDSEPKMTD